MQSLIAILSLAAFGFAPTVFAQPATARAEPPQQPSQSTATSSLGRGVTFEANLGLGLVYEGGGRGETFLAAGLSLGLGGPAGSRLAITGRASVVTSDMSNSGPAWIVVGPNAQYWINDHAWLGGGAGLGIALQGGAFGAVAFDLRAGHTFNPGSPHTLNVSVELTPGLTPDSGGIALITGFGVLVGYQCM